MAELAPPRRGEVNRMWYVYVLKSLNNGSHYIGCTSDINRRIREHNRGENISTKKHSPFKLLHSETYASQHEAFKREKVIKSYKGGEAFKKLIQRRAGGGVVNRTWL